MNGSRPINSNQRYNKPKYKTGGRAQGDVSKRKFHRGGQFKNVNTVHHCCQEQDPWVQSGEDMSGWGWKVRGHGKSVGIRRKGGKVRGSAGAPYVGQAGAGRMRRGGKVRRRR